MKGCSLKALQILVFVAKTLCAQLAKRKAALTFRNHALYKPLLDNSKMMKM